MIARIVSGFSKPPEYRLIKSLDCPRRCNARLMLTTPRLSPTPEATRSSSFANSAPAPVSSTAVRIALNFSSFARVLRRTETERRALAQPRLSAIRNPPPRLFYFHVGHNYVWFYTSARKGFPNEQTASAVPASPPKCLPLRSLCGIAALCRGFERRTLISPTRSLTAASRACSRPDLGVQV